MEITLVANLKRNAPAWPDMPPGQWDDLDSWDTIQSIAMALEKRGHRVTFLEGDKFLYNNLDAVKPDFCFNLCKSHFGDSREAQIPAILELLRIRYTGSPVLTLALAEDKVMTKRILIYHGLPTPTFQVFEHAEETVSARLHYPLRVISSRLETGLDISTSSIIHDQNQLRAQLRRNIDRYHQPVLVEQHLEGRRITVGLVGNLTSPIARQIPDDETIDHIFQSLHIFPPRVVKKASDLTTETVHKAKTNFMSDIHNPLALLPENCIENLKWLAAITFRVMGCLDVASIDFQLDANDNDKPYILNINPLPSLNPGYSDLCITAQADGWSYDKLINCILQKAIDRYQLNGRNNPLSVLPMAESPAGALL